MFIAEMIRLTLLRAPEDGAGAGADTAAAGAGDDTIAGSAGNDTAAGAGNDTLAAGGDDTVAAGDPPAASKWWEDKRYDEATQAQLKALGLTVDDPLDAVKSLAGMERAAKVKLGKGVDQLMEKPGKDQDVGEWLRKNGDTFGIPESPEKYDIKPPEGWPKDQQWDSDFEAEARQLAHDAGIPGAALQKFTDLYAGKVSKLMGDAETDLQQANDAMQTDLQKDWGDQYDAKIAQVQQISSVLAEKAGLDADAMSSLAATLKPKIGDANTIRLFAAVAEMAGDDVAGGLGAGGGATGVTPAEARARLEEMKAPGSEYSKAAEEARKTGNRARFNELHKSYLSLTKIAAG